MSVRLKDIASIAGVSVGAVQQILAGRGDRFRVETCQRVRDCAQSLGYRPDVNAMALRTGRSYLIGVLLSGVNYSNANGFYEGVQAGLGGSEYAPICFTHNSQSEEESYLKRCLERRVDGLIVNASVDEEVKKHTRKLSLPKGTPLIEVFGSFLTGAVSITNNDELAGEQAVAQLASAGCKSICLFTHDQYDRYRKSPAPFWNAWHFYRGCLAAAQNEGLPLNVRTHPLAKSPGKSFEAAREAIKTWPTPAEDRVGYCCFGVEEARALETYFRNATSHGGIKPQAVTYADKRVYSDRPDWMAMVQPDVHSVGRLATESLLRLIEGKAAESRRIEPTPVGVDLYDSKD